MTAACMRGLRKRFMFAEPLPRRLLSTAAVFLILVTITSFLGSWWWLLDLASHFRIQLAATSLILLLAALFVRSGPALGLSIVAAVANGFPLTPYLTGLGQAQSAPHPDLRVMALNMHGSDTDPEAFRSLLDSEEPDVILLTELPEGEEGLLLPLSARYPYLIANRRGSPFDVVLLSRWRVESWSVDRGAASFLPVLTARICDTHSETRCLTLIGLHAARPVGSGFQLQQAQLRLATDAVKAAPKGHALVMGDLNLTPWSATFRRFVHTAGLSIHPQERGLETTWLSRFPLFGLAIDHVLAGPGNQVIQSRVGRDVGSDHLPIIAHVAFGPS